MVLTVAIAALAQLAASADAAPRASLSESLYWASTGASGSRLCDRKRSARYTQQFDRRFGERIRRLMAYHVSTFGPDPEFIITTSCLLSGRSGRAQDRDHARAMDAFEPTLHDLEQRFGPAGG